MPRFRKKPVEIEAVQWNGKWAEVIAWLDSLAAGGTFRVPFGMRPPIRVDHTDTRYLLIDTLEGTMRASEGDWIIRGVQGELYPCKPDIFDVTYEPTEVAA